MTVEYAIEAHDDSGGLVAWPDTARLNAQELDYIYLKARIGYGVKSGLAVTQHSGTPNMSVDVASGHAWVGGVDVTVSGATVTIAASDPALGRWDLLQVSPSGTITVRSGAKLSVKPPMPAPDPNATVIALVYVAPATSAITDGTSATPVLIRNVGIAIGQHGAVMHSSNPVPIGAYLEMGEIADPGSAANKSRIYRKSTGTPSHLLMAHSDGRTPVPLEGLEFLASGKLVNPSSITSLAVSVPARDHLVAFVRAPRVSSTLIGLQFNGDTGAHYAHRTVSIVDGTPTAFTSLTSSNADSSLGLFTGGLASALIRVQIANATTRAKSATWRALECTSVGSLKYTLIQGAGSWNNLTAPITSVDLVVDPGHGAGPFLDGASLTVFGYNDGPNYD